MMTGIRPGVEAKDQEAAKEWREMRVRRARMFTTAAGLGHNFSNKYLKEEMGDKMYWLDGCYLLYVRIFLTGECKEGMLAICCCGLV